MVRKTISIDEQLFAELQNEGVLEHFKNFSDLVSNALRKSIESVKEEKYRKQIQEMANDPLVKNDIDEIEQAFRYADGEFNAF
ncbi:MAG: hypothetical protein U9P71_01305 [Campylobacterota bacterium]|nr:hypothetical protein [Campylobacterota bacterium]